MGLVYQLWTGLLRRRSLTEERPILLILLLPRPELLHHAEEQLHGLPVGALIQINEKVYTQVFLCVEELQPTETETVTDLLWFASSL